MSEQTSELLTKVEDALWLGDQRTAGVLLHKILLQDFTNHQAWLLLYQMRGGKQPLEEFQQRFAQRYYPQLAHLLGEPPTPQPAPFIPKPPPVQPEPSPQIPSAHDLEARPESPAPAPLSPEPVCPGCGADIPLGAEACPYCRLPVTLPTAPEPEPVSPEPELAAPEPEPASPEPELSALEPEPVSPEPELAAPEPEPASPEPELAVLEPALHAMEAEPVSTGSDLLPEELDLLLKRSAPPPPAAPFPEAEPPLEPAIYLAPEVASTQAEQPAAIRSPYCPTCNKTFSREDLFCDTCGAPLFRMVDQTPAAPPVDFPGGTPAETATPPAQPTVKPLDATPVQAAPAAPEPLPAAPSPAPTPLATAQTPPGIATVRLLRKDAYAGSLKVFRIWIDGQRHGKIGNNQELTFTLPSGEHTFVLKFRANPSQPFSVDLKPGEVVYMVCRFNLANSKNTFPEMEIIPTSAPKPQVVKRRLPRGCSIALWILLLTIVLAAIGVAAYSLNLFGF